jgi:hypothetical protein
MTCPRLALVSFGKCLEGIGAVPGKSDQRSKKWILSGLVIFGLSSVFVLDIGVDKEKWLGDDGYI